MVGLQSVECSFIICGLFSELLKIIKQYWLVVMAKKYLKVLSLCLQNVDTFG